MCKHAKLDKMMHVVQETRGWIWFKMAACKVSTQSWITGSIRFKRPASS